MIGLVASSQIVGPSHVPEVLPIVVALQHESFREMETDLSYDIHALTSVESKKKWRMPSLFHMHLLITLAVTHTHTHTHIQIHIHIQYTPRTHPPTHSESHTTSSTKDMANIAIETYVGESPSICWSRLLSDHCLAHIHPHKTVRTVLAARISSSVWPIHTMLPAANA